MGLGFRTYIYVRKYERVKVLCIAGLHFKINIVAKLKILHLQIFICFR